jgi:hypothetical protein
MKKQITVLMGCILITCLLLAGCNNNSAPEKDSDNDGSPDSQDLFPFDPAASKDNDKDGHPDEWNTGWDTNETTNLTLDALPDDPNEWQDIDGDGYGDNSDAFPFDQEIHGITYVAVRNYTLAASGQLDLNFQTNSDDKYVSIYWELTPETEMVGDTMSIRFKSSEQWLVDVWHGITGQARTPVTQTNYGNWILKINHDQYRTGYAGQITIYYRLFTLQ